MSFVNCLWVISLWYNVFLCNFFNRFLLFVLCPRLPLESQGEHPFPTPYWSLIRCHRKTDQDGRTCLMLRWLFVVLVPNLSGAEVGEQFIHMCTCFCFLLIKKNYLFILTIPVMIFARTYWLVPQRRHSYWRPSVPRKALPDLQTISHRSAHPPVISIRILLVIGDITWFFTDKIRTWNKQFD